VSDRSAAPLRFVWRTDADGRFSALSPNLAEIVGNPRRCDRPRFKTGNAFGLDAREIAGLLERRDTGRPLRAVAAPATI